MKLSEEDRQMILHEASVLAPQLQSDQGLVFSNLPEDFWSQLSNRTTTSVEILKKFLMKRCQKKIQPVETRVEILTLISENFETYQDQMSLDWLLKLMPQYDSKQLKHFLSSLAYTDLELEQIPGEIEKARQCSVVAESTTQETTQFAFNQDQKPTINQTEIQQETHETNSETKTNLDKPTNSLFQVQKSTTVQQFEEKLAKNELVSDETELKLFLKTLVKDCISLKERNLELKRKCQQVVRYMGRMQNVFE